MPKQPVPKENKGADICRREVKNHNYSHLSRMMATNHAHAIRDWPTAISTKSLHYVKRNTWQFDCDFISAWKNSQLGNNNRHLAGPNKKTISITLLCGHAETLTVPWFAADGAPWSQAEIGSGNKNHHLSRPSNQQNHHLSGSTRQQ